MRRKERAPNEIVGGKPSSFQSCDLPDWGERGRAVKQAGKPAGTLEGQLPHALRGKINQQQTTAAQPVNHHRLLPAVGRLSLTQVNSSGLQIPSHEHAVMRTSFTICPSDSDS